MRVSDLIMHLANSIFSDMRDNLKLHSWVVVNKLYLYFWTFPAISDLFQYWLFHVTDLKSAPARSVPNYIPQ